jgi:mannose-6-phosphate isomerase-like protein (cupin superfamily)
MTMQAQSSFSAEGSTEKPGTGVRFHFPYRPFGRLGSRDSGAAPRRDFKVSLTADVPVRGTAGLRAVAPFLADAAHDMVPTVTLARMIGRYCFAAGGMAEPEVIAVSLTCPDGTQATALVERPEFETEQTVFGTAHILHEDDTLGLYILEIAANGAIPAHCHHRMRESELILDDGLLQQGLPVARGSAFDWPLGHIHAYTNPTRQPRRILCIDSPRFCPMDEVALWPPPPLVPLAPMAHYPA